MKTASFVLVAILFLAAAVGIGIYGWVSSDGAQMGAHGWIALTLGTVLSIVVGAGLMALVFISSRRGYDDAAHYIDDDTKV